MHEEMMSLRLYLGYDENLLLLTIYRVIYVQ